MKKLLVALVLFSMASCASPGIDALEGHATDLIKESHSVQADENGLAEFVIPGLLAGTGVPLVQTYEVTTQKFQLLFLVHVPHTLDARGVVYVETDPDAWLLIVVVRQRAATDD